MSDPDKFYETLRIPPASPVDAITAAWRTLQKEYHPDYSKKAREAKEMPDPVARDAKLKELSDFCCKINEAKQYLTDPEKKKRYDAGIGKDGPVHDSSTIFDFFSNFSGSRGARVKKVDDTIFKVSITLKESFLGKKSKYRVKRKVVCKGCSGKGGENERQCDGCNGRGTVHRENRRGFFVTVQEVLCEKCAGEKTVHVGPKCGVCKGEKYTREESMIEVEIDMGVTDGKLFQFTGMGDERVGHVAGNLVFQISVKDDPRFARVNNDIVTRMELDLYTALAGGKILFDHIDGRVLEIEMARVVSFDDCVKVAGEGFFDGSSGKGDLYIKPVYKIPKIDRKELAKLMEVPKVVEKNVDKNVRGKFGEMPVAEPEEDSGHGAFRGFSFF